ncbi:hypothetical protein G6F49_001249 [Rhizopus delemar]|nr:hypothetical protein G6F49_001249 [Rhizopus delemar]
MNIFTSSQLKQVENTQNKCIRKIYGVHDRSSIKVMTDLSILPSISKRDSILQAQLFFRSLYLPEDTLLSRLLPYIQRTRGHRWYLLHRTPLWKMVLFTTDDLDTRVFKDTKRHFLQQNLNQR